MAIRSLQYLHKDRIIQDVILSSAATVIQLPGLNLMNGNTYRLQAGLQWSASSDAKIEFNAAGNSTGLNVRVIAGYAGGPGSAESMAPGAGTISGGDANGISFVSADLALVGGRVAMTGITVRSYSTGHNWVWTLFSSSALNSITSIQIRCGAANGFKSGSFLQVIKG